MRVLDDDPDGGGHQELRGEAAGGDTGQGEQEERVVKAWLQVGWLLEAVRSLGVEDLGALGEVLATVSRLLHTGDMEGLEETMGDVLEAGQGSSSLP